MHSELNAYIIAILSHIANHIYLYMRLFMLYIIAL